MAKEIYQQLAHHLDNLPGGFPTTESGVELRILRKFFTPEEAELALHLTLIPEESRIIARRAKTPAREVAPHLKEMSKKGLIFSIEPEGRRPLYMAAQYVIGIWEYHVNDLDPELIRDMNEYIPTLFHLETWEKAPQLRTIPVGRSISAQVEVLPYEKVEDLVRSQKKFLVAPCICRREHKMVGKGCEKPEESCLVFGLGVDYYKRNGIGREIDLEENLEILKRADKAGLVLQPTNARKIMNICCCCGCCCQILKNVKRHPIPASLIASPFIVSTNPETCKGCGVCVERCQMEALKLEDERVALDPDRCIGCGLCISTCPTKSITLGRKPESEQRKVPRDIVESTIQLGKVRGKLGPVTLATMQIRSKLDRFLATK